MTISLGTGQFGDTGKDTVTLTGLRVSADVQCLGGDSMPQSALRIFGLPLSMVNQLTTVGPVNAAIMLKNSVLLAAGDDENGMETVYSGTILTAFGDFKGMPEVPLNVMAVGGLDAAVKPVGALSFIGAADVATIMASLADTMGLAFENNGVQVQLSNPYFPGTALTQVKACARAADIYYTIDRGTLAIWPKAGARAGGDIPIISPDTGSVGYPTFSSNGIEIDCEFNPALKVGGMFQVKSALPVAQGNWRAMQVVHALDSEVPNGRWFTHVTGVPLYGD
ncbi:hypothetical protein [Burkholderia sp. LMG 13014]|uniref:baseplate hub protein n=1 Tax=Burkholderia sp. LMG 13014 TaxID=2709306 RepID=UPI001F063AE9|nr:hypothetical protein [Burkholderia sp. LMG 13014]